MCCARPAQETIGINLNHLSWDTFRFCLIFATSCSISLSNYGPTTILFTGLSKFIGVLHLLPYKASYGLIPNDEAYVHCYMRILPTINNAPTWLV